MNLSTNLIIVFLATVTLGFAIGDNAPAPFERDQPLQSVLREAYSLRDFEGLKAIEDFNTVHGTELKPWEGNFDYTSESRPGDAEFPWRKTNFNHKGQWIEELDLSLPGHAEVFSDLVFDYVMKGWFNEHNKANADAQFRENPFRTWCSTPWVVDGPGGRDAVHGLTRELALRPNPVYPADGKVLVEGLPYDERPQGWGVPFFNKVVCEEYAKVFGNSEKPKFPPAVESYKSPDGFVSFKLHFNSLPGWEKYDGLDGVYAWHAHVSDKPSSNYRSIKKIPLVQIAVSVKDSQLKGLDPDLDYWAMLVYTFDPNYLRDGSKVVYLPEALRKMKPMGVQFGFEPDKTVMFRGAKTNYMRHGEFIGEGPEALLNGPADNAESSCMGCHASGFSINSENIQKEFTENQFSGRGNTWKFTFYRKQDYLKVKEKYGLAFDFNLQMESADFRIQNWIKNKE